jgi:septum formation protein
LHKPEKNKAQQCAAAIVACTLYRVDNTAMTLLQNDLSSAPTTGQRALVLGSTSRYRRELLQRFGLPFDVVGPHVDETPQPNEAPAALAQRLALAKAQAVAAQRPDAIVVGSDQVADLHGQPLGKPGTHERAVAQLRQMSGQTVLFQTAVAVVCAATGLAACELAVVRVVFRELTDAEIERYLRAEQPYDCAGSAKSEGLGITLLNHIDNDDPTALIGLPLIRTARLLRLAGLQLP